MPLLIEMYAAQLKKAGPDDVYCFVTSNHRDFSAPNGDHRQPHPDVADISMEEFLDRVWYVRSIVHADAENEEVPEDIRAGARAARRRVEDRYGRDSLCKPIGPGHDEAWEYGYISGKLATLRWVLGSEGDFLDT